MKINRQKSILYVHNKELKEPHSKINISSILTLRLNRWLLFDKIVFKVFCLNSNASSVYADGGSAQVVDECD